MFYFLSNKSYNSYMSKMILLDLDGTTLNTKEEITDYTKEVLNLARDEYDCKIVFASARGFYRMKGYIDQIENDKEDQYTICFNGAIISNNTGKAIYSLPIEKNTNHLICETVSKYPTYKWMYYLNDKTIFSSEIEDLPSFLDNNEVYKIVVVSKEEDITAMRESLSKEMYDSFAITSSLANRIEFVANGISKSKAITYLQDYLRIDQKDVIAMGDGENDIPMIKHANIGVAMANAKAPVKEAADLVSPYDNDHDAVAKSILAILTNNAEELAKMKK